MNSRGFTLIELLVVIAIISILSTVVLASLNQSRDKGANSAIKANLANIRSMAELYYDNNNGSYGSFQGLGACPAIGTTNLFGDPNVYNAIESARRAVGSSATATCMNRTTSPIGWAVSVPLKTPESTFFHWCVDSNGSSKGRATAITTNSC